MVPLDSSHSRLLGLDPSGSDDLGRTFTLAQHEARKLGLRHIHRLASVLGNPVAQTLPREHASDVLHKFVNHSGRSASRRPYPIPNGEVETGDTSLRDCWNLR